MSPIINNEYSDQLHWAFDTHADAQSAWELLQADESIPQEKRDLIAPPRQAVPNIWIFEKVQ